MTAVSFRDIEDEFEQTFGYVKQDIGAILQEDLRLHYTIAWLVCCACGMLAWHRDLQEHQIFAALFPNTESYRAIGKTLWEALRNGLAHNFRPHTIEIGEDQWRFSISSGSDPIMMVDEGDPHWIHLNIRTCSTIVISRIDDYEQELRTSAAARTHFQDKSRRTLKVIPDSAVKIAHSLKSLIDTRA